MAFFILNFLVFLLAHIRSLRVGAVESCKGFDYMDCMKDKVLIGHVFKTLNIPVPGLEICQNKCFHEEQCVSYNLGPIDGAIRTCELNDLDHWGHSSALVVMNGYEYCPIENPCSSSPCPTKEPVCVPNFDLNTYSCRDGVWPEWSAWSCTCPRKSRTRQCTNPKTNQPATDCGPGERQQTTSCSFAVNIPACKASLGMQDGRITNAQITSSGDFTGDYRCSKYNARLNTADKNHAWCAKSNQNLKSSNQYIQIDFDSVRKVTQVATQGRPGPNQYVTQYYLSFSNDSTTWFHYVGNEQCTVLFAGNVDKSSVVVNKLSVPTTARYIRVFPLAHSGYPSMRLEFYGC